MEQKMEEEIQLLNEEPPVEEMWKKTYLKKKWKRKSNR